MSIFLETDRLTLRRFTPANADLLADLNSDPEVMRFISGGQPTPRAEARDRIIPYFLDCYERFDGLGYWAAEASATGDFLGWFQFRPVPDAGVELGYRLRRAAWHAGYATEGSRAILRQGFTECGVERVFARTLAANTASRRVLEKCGLTFVRAFRAGRVPADGPGPDAAEPDTVEYALTRPAWEAGRPGPVSSEPERRE
jgi:RimJ/RimL family protein N-acetyltransferase